MCDEKKYRILFVCLGNICRSPAAEGVMQRLVEARGVAHRFEIDSAGTYGGHSGQLPDPRMRRHASRRGYDLTHRARKITGYDMGDFDMIVAMDNANRADLVRLARTPEEVAKIVMIGNYITTNPHYDYVPDPYYEGSEGFELALDLLEDACGQLLNEILTERLNNN